MSEPLPDISVVLPTFNRLPALRENFCSVLDQAGVSEIVVVIDGSTDGSAEWLEARDDDRLRLIRQPQAGSPAARNRGIAAARGAWILMTEDDCFLPAGFVITLLEVARAREAQIVGAPWLSIRDRRQMNEALERGRRDARARVRLSTPPSVFPVSELETPFLNGVVLVRRDVFEVIHYDESFGGNAWREETSMFLDAVGAGFRCVLTPRTAVFQFGQWSGGQRRTRLSYEAWAIRNNWRFLCAHRRTLRALGEIRHPVPAQAAFVAGRIRTLASGTARRRWGSLVAQPPTSSHNPAQKAS